MVFGPAGFLSLTLVVQYVLFFISFDSCQFEIPLRQVIFKPPKTKNVFTKKRKKRKKKIHPGLTTSRSLIWHLHIIIMCLKIVILYKISYIKINFQWVGKKHILEALWFQGSCIFVVHPYFHFMLFKNFPLSFGQRKVIGRSAQG